MRYLFFLGFFAFSCNDSNNEINESSICYKQMNVASINLCIPSFGSYKEVYSNLEAKRVIDELQPVENNILAYFVLDSSSLLNDFISISIPNQWMDLDMDKYYLKELGNTFTKKMDEYIPKEFDLVSFNKPRLVDKYQFDDKIYSFIVLVKSKENEGAFLSHISIVLVKNRTFAVATNKLYVNKNTISELKLRADNYNKKFLESNP
jgi:hypothetical protein